MPFLSVQKYCLLKFLSHEKRLLVAYLCKDLNWSVLIIKHRVAYLKYDSNSIIISSQIIIKKSYVKQLSFIII